MLRPLALDSGYEFSALKDEHTELGKAFENMFAIMGSGSLYSLFTHLFPAIRTPGRILSKEQRSLAASQAVVHRISEGLLEGAKQEARKEAAGKATHVHKDSFKNKDLLSLLGECMHLDDCLSDIVLTMQDLSVRAPLVSPIQSLRRPQTQ